MKIKGDEIIGEDYRTFNKSISFEGSDAIIEKSVVRVLDCSGGKNKELESSVNNIETTYEEIKNDSALQVAYKKLLHLYEHNTIMVGRLYANRDNKEFIIKVLHAIIADTQQMIEDINNDQDAN